MNLVYHVPARLIREYEDQFLIIRSRDPLELARAASRLEPDRIVHLQLTVPGPEVGPLTRIDPALGVDLLLERNRDYACLYDYLSLASGRPVRVSLSLGPGAVRSAKLAAALKMPIGLNLGQPDRAVAEILFQLLDFFLHDRTVVQPVEFFHSLLHAFFHRQPVSLWSVQGEDPQDRRYVTGQGRVVLSPRLADLPTPLDWPTFQKLNPRPACAGCRHLNVCQGFFRWPDWTYDCRPMQDILDAIARAARELAEDLGRAPGIGETAP